MRLQLTATLLALTTSLAAQQHRPPAVPLAVNDPYFSLWSMSDHLTDTPVKHWTEVAQPLNGLIRIDGETFRWMGTHTPARGHLLPAMHQTAVELTPLHTRYTFTDHGIQLNLTFFTPSFPQDLDVLSRPLTYMSFAVASTDGAPHTVSVLLDVSPQIAVNDIAQPVTWGRFQTPNLNVLRIGTRDQSYLHQSGDRIRLDWGYFNLAIPSNEQAQTELSSEALDQFIETGALANKDSFEMPRPAGAHLAAVFPLGQVTATPVARHVELAFPEGYAIEYLGRKLHGYWQRNGMSEADMLTAAETDFPALEARGLTFDRDLNADMTTVGGPDYAYLAALLFRQTLAAHKLVADIDGSPMLFSKENDSNGCIDTVDVTYPSSPFFLFFNPRLLQAQIDPVLRYAELPRWRFPFAPHDLGTFPLANGQVYGGGERNEDDQMPIEESGNLLLMIAALGRAQGNYDYAKPYMNKLTQWAAYLEAKGLDPENQLSTDDFSGHLAHNTNLSIKAIEALGAFAEIARGVGDKQLAEHYSRLAHTLPAKWEAMAFDGDHYKLAFDQPGTWSQKYNLVWDTLLDLHLFSPKVMQTDWAYYQKHLEPYGLPLDNRKDITKLDWEVWTATLGSPEQSQDLIHRLVLWADSTSSRVPTTDFYDARTGKQQAFQARSVVGGIFIKALANPTIAAKWKYQPKP